MDFHERVSSVTDLNVGICSHRHRGKLDTMPKVHLLDYAAGNIRSLVNAIEKLGWEVDWIQSPDDVAKAEVSE